MTSVPKLIVAEVEEAIGPIEGFANSCHSASLALVRSGLLPEVSRVPWAKREADNGGGRSKRARHDRPGRADR